MNKAMRAASRRTDELNPIPVIDIAQAQEPAVISAGAEPERLALLDPGPRGRPRNRSSLARRAAMTKLLRDMPNWSFNWLTHPILQSDTRLAAMADPRSGRLLVQGWEKTGPATARLDLVEPA